MQFGLHETHLSISLEPLILAPVAQLDRVLPSELPEADISVVLESLIGLGIPIVCLLENCRAARICHSGASPVMSQLRDITY